MRNFFSFSLISMLINTMSVNKGMKKNMVGPDTRGTLNPFESLLGGDGNALNVTSILGIVWSIFALE